MGYISRKMRQQYTVAVRVDQMVGLHHSATVYSYEVCLASLFSPLSTEIEQLDKFLYHLRFFFESVSARNLQTFSCYV